MNEVKDSRLLDLLRNRRSDPPVRRSRSIVWPARPGIVPDIPFRAYADHVQRVFRDNAAANKRVEDYIAGLNRQRGLDDLAELGLTEGEIIVYHGKNGDQLLEVGAVDWPSNLVPTNGQPVGIRETIRPTGDDVCPVDNEQSGQTATSRWADCENYNCEWWYIAGDMRSCLDRQRTGTCPKKPRRDNRPDAGRVQKDSDA